MNLNALAIKYGTDKSSSHHNYCPHYENHFGSFRDKEVVLWNCGFGGYHFFDRGGGDSLMFAEFSPKWKIFVTDIYDKKDLGHNRVFFRKGDQKDDGFWNGLLNETGAPDIFIDDASHINPLTLRTFEIVYPVLKDGGLYCIEDVESSWWEEHGFQGCKDPEDYKAPTAINLVRWLMNDLNKKHVPNFEARYKVSEIHCYPNLVIIKK